MGRVVFTQSARNDLLAAWLFIAEENPAAAGCPQAYGTWRAWQNQCRGDPGDLEFLAD
jgi:plasmid stabilization system protein ParE